MELRANLRNHKCLCASDPCRTCLHFNLCYCACDVAWYRTLRQCGFAGVSGIHHDFIGVALRFLHALCYVCVMRTAYSTPRVCLGGTLVTRLHFFLIFAWASYCLTCNLMAWVKSNALPSFERFIGTEGESMLRPDLPLTWLSPRSSLASIAVVRYGVVCRATVSLV